jgi:NADPH-ferrihemoprotein reductase
MTRNKHYFERLDLIICMEPIDAPELASYRMLSSLKERRAAATTTTMSSTSTTSTPSVPLSAVIGTGSVTLVLASFLAYALLGRHRLRRQASRSDTQSAFIGTTTTTATSPETNKDDEFDWEKYPGGSVTIYFATQTGTSESLAREIEREGPNKGFMIHVVDVEDIVLDDESSDDSTAAAQQQQQQQSQARLETALAPRSLFLVSTYGEGEAPDHAVRFVQQLQKAANLESILIPESSSSTSSEMPPSNNGPCEHDNAKTLEFAVFGLGNRQYDHYNAMGRFFDTALSRLSCARRLVPVGLGDDNVDLEADFEAWKDTVWWPAVVQRYWPNDDGVTTAAAHATTTFTLASTKSSATVETKLPDCPLQVTYHDSATAATATTMSPQFDLAPDQVHSSSRHYFTALECPVTLVRELQTQEASTLSSSTVHVEIDISAARALTDRGGTAPASLTYSTADNLGVLPVNDPAVVEAVAHALGYDLDAVFSVSNAPGHEWHGAPFPMPCTVRECLTRYCDVTSAPRRSDLKLLASYCRDPLDRSALLRMAAKEGRAEYKEKILDNYTGLVNLLQKCPSLQLPLEHFLNVCSPLQTRFFTIASSSSRHPTTVHLTVAVTQHVRPQDQSIFHGVCSTHLAKGGEQTKETSGTAISTVRVFNRPSSFRLPVDSTRPILMIGPGTGVAPMRAFLQERLYQRDVLKKPVGTNILYFGCKRKSQDYIYQDEMEEFVASGILNHLRVAFSREQGEKIYVQHLLKEHAAETWELFHESKVHVYVCGGVKMGQDVSEALREIIASQGSMSMGAAKEYLTKMSHDGRFVQELWA